MKEPTSGDEDRMKEPTSDNVTEQKPVAAPSPSRSRPWLDTLEQPWWLNNSLYDDVWYVKDKSPKVPECIDWVHLLSDPNGENFSFLTDADNAHLLETGQLLTYHVRDGNFATVSSALYQAAIARYTMTIFAWMSQHNVFRVDQLIPEHFTKFKTEAVYGTAYLLDAPRRLELAVVRFRKNGEPLPSKPVYPYRRGIDVDALGRAMGVQFSRIERDPRISHRMRQLEREEGFYIVPQRRYRLDQDPPERTVLKSKALARALKPWQALWEQRSLFTDRLRFDPFLGVPVKVVAKQAIKASGEEIEDGVTLTLPEYQAAFLIDRSIRWVLYADDLLALRDRYERIFQDYQEMCAKKRQPVEHRKRSRTTYRRMDKFLAAYSPVSFTSDDPTYAAAPWPLSANALFTRGHRKNTNLIETENSSALSIGKALYSYLPIACAIVICAFTGRRHDEVITILGENNSADDIRPRAIETDEEGPWLWCWIEKNVQAWDRTPCPRLVVRAVQVLERLSQSAHDLTGTRILFQVKQIGGSVCRRATFGETLKEFAKFVQVPALEDGSYWNFTPHQFRKFFSVLYFHGYEYANLTALSLQLRQFDLQVTEHYVNDHINDTFLSRARQHHSAKMIADIATGVRKAAGPAGRRIANMLSRQMKRVMKNIEILPATYSPEAAAEVAKRFLKKLAVEWIPFLWGYCAAFKKLEHGRFTGNCVEGDTRTDGPNLVNAKPVTCYKCDHFYVDQHFRPFWQTMAATYGQHVQRPELGPSLRTIIEENAAVFKQGLQEYFDEQYGD